MDLQWPIGIHVHYGFSKLCVSTATCFPKNLHTADSFTHLHDLQRLFTPLHLQHGINAPHQPCKCTSSILSDHFSHPIHPLEMLHNGPMEAEPLGMPALTLMLLLTCHMTVGQAENQLTFSSVLVEYSFPELPVRARSPTFRHQRLQLTDALLLNGKIASIHGKILLSPLAFFLYYKLVLSYD